MSRISITEFLVTIILIFALVQGAASLYQRFLLTVNQRTIEKLEQAQR